MATRKRGAKAPDESEQPEQPPSADGDAHESNGGGTEARTPAHVLSYLVARDTYVQASIWARTVRLADGSEFTAHDVTVRKRGKDASGQWQSYHSFRGSE